MKPTLPSFSTYGNYSSSNYGAHALVFSMAKGDVYFSYKTPVAFRTFKTGLVVRENDWGPTTGKHLNAICTDKKTRIPGDQFEQELAAAFE
jgi:hypothetical protein